MSNGMNPKMSKAHWGEIILLSFLLIGATIVLCLLANHQVHDFNISQKINTKTP